MTQAPRNNASWLVLGLGLQPNTQGLKMTQEQKTQTPEQQNTSKHLDIYADIVKLQIALRERIGQLPSSRSVSIALTKLDEQEMWLAKSVGENVGSTTPTDILRFLAKSVLG
jgi:hypothetical protein